MATLDATVSAFVLVVIGVGVCIGVVASWLLRADEPATLRSEPVVRSPSQPRPSTRGPGTPDRPARPRRRRRPPEGEPNLPTPPWRRLLSALELLSIATLLGVAAAAGVGLLVLLFFMLLRSTIG